MPARGRGSGRERRNGWHERIDRVGGERVVLVLCRLPLGGAGLRDDASGDGDVGGVGDVGPGARFDDLGGPAVVDGGGSGGGGGDGDAAVVGGFEMQVWVAADGPGRVVGDGVAVFVGE